MKSTVGRGGERGPVKGCKAIATGGEWRGGGGGGGGGRVAEAIQMPVAWRVIRRGVIE